MKPHKSIQVFKNPFLEKFTHIHPLTPLVAWAPIFCWFVWETFGVLELSPYVAGVLGVAGFLTWTFVEYVLHRFVFHFEGESQLGKRLHFLLHGLHHIDPTDPTRLVLPPVMSMGFGYLLYCLFRLILGPVWVTPFFAFFIIGYLCYDYIHFYVHHFNPTSKIGKYLKNGHMQHHYVNPNMRVGVSSPLWDYVFGTVEDVKDKEHTVSH
jgi:sterol desaturase/sphingolipid hydroxylase (fatty acid hydroxylase superfamily)